MGSLTHSLTDRGVIEMDEPVCLSSMVAGAAGFDVPDK